ncbi:MAG: hypothetical protein IPH41_16530 [Sulfuritalea sp.]|nr:hypothetical protein [Sulfuritalea sp.]
MHCSFFGLLKKLSVARCPSNLPARLIEQIIPYLSTAPGRNSALCFPVGVMDHPRNAGWNHAMVSASITMSAVIRD